MKLTTLLLVIPSVLGFSRLERTHNGSHGYAHRHSLARRSHGGLQNQSTGSLAARDTSQDDACIEPRSPHGGLDRFQEGRHRVIEDIWPRNHEESQEEDKISSAAAAQPVILHESTTETHSIFTTITVDWLPISLSSESSSSSSSTAAQTASTTTTSSSSVSGMYGQVPPPYGWESPSSFSVYSYSPPVITPPVSEECLDITVTITKTVTRSTVPVYYTTITTTRTPPFSSSSTSTTTTPLYVATSTSTVTSTTTLTSTTRVSSGLSSPSSAAASVAVVTGTSTAGGSKVPRPVTLGEGRRGGGAALLGLVGAAAGFLVWL